jgi:DNA-binding transcriptional LysR family regulator
MPDIDLNHVDLNLLRIFMALIEEGSVTGAADRLGIAQSSLSHSLGRLRTIFNNPLFVRTTRGMQPTARALRLAEAIRQAFDILQFAFSVDEEFDSTRNERTFRLIMTDIVAMLILPSLMRFLYRSHSKVSVVVDQYPRNMYRDILEQGKADIALGQLPMEHTDFYQRHLFSDELVCFADRNNPIVQHFTLETYLEARHLVVGTPALSETMVRKALGQKAAQRKVALYVPHYAVAPSSLIGTDMMTVLPRSVGTQFTTSGDLIELPLPFSAPPLTVRQFWHRRTNDDPGCRWLRGVIADQFDKSGVLPVNDAFT